MQITEDRKTLKTSEIHVCTNEKKAKENKDKKFNCMT